MHMPPRLSSLQLCSSRRPVRAGRPVWALVLAGVLLATSFAGRTAHGQASPSDTTGSGPSPLPEIAPQEIEIRGELQIQFPSLQRQPLTAFAPASPVPSYPTDRLPSAETYTQSLSDLPESRPTLEPVSSTIEASASPLTGLVEAGGGRYVSRFARGRLQVPLGPHESITVRGDYEGTDGHEPFEASSIQTAYDDLHGAIRFASRRSRVRATAGLTGRYNDYTLFGARPVPAGSEPASAARPVETQPDRTRRSLGGDAALHLRGSVPASIALSYAGTGVDTQIRPDSLADAQTVEERRFTAEASLRVPIGRSRLHLDGRTAAAGLGGAGAFDGDVVSLDLGARALLVKQGPLRVTGGARLLTYQAPVGGSSSGTASATFVAPAVEASFHPGSRVRIFARNRPQIRGNSVRSVMETNPFLEATPTIRPTLETTRAETGVEVTAGVVRLSASAGYRYAPSFLYYASSPSTGYRDGVFQARYASAQIIHGGVRVALQGLDRVQASLGARIRDAERTDGSRSIPNFAALKADGMVAWSFADDRGFLQLSASALGPRPREAPDAADVDAYVDIDVEGSFQVSPLLEVLASIENIGATERWPRYERAPGIVSGGIRIQW